MKHVIGTAIITAGLAACGGAPSDQAILTQQCNALFSDAKFAADTSADRGAAKPEVFCDCLGEKLAAGSDPDLYKTVLGKVARSMAETGDTVEHTILVMLENTDDPNGDAALSEEDVKAVGQVFDELSADMKDTGTCPT